MAKKIKGAAKAKSTGKRIVKAKTTASAGGFTLNVPAALAKKLGVIAENDSKFKGSNPSRYAMHILKDALT